MPFLPGTLVVAHLVNPNEKLWGVLEELAPAGVTLRALNLGSFEDWSLELAREGRSGLGLATMFVPLFRVERIFLDEQVGEVESYRRRFERRVGARVERFVSVGEEPAAAEAPEPGSGNVF